MGIVSQYDLRQYDVKEEKGIIPGYAAEGAGDAAGSGAENAAAVAKEVIAGVWGNGEERRERLESAGYDYQAVQEQVNGLLRESVKC